MESRPGLKETGMAELAGFDGCIIYNDCENRTKRARRFKGAIVYVWDS